MTRTHFQNQRKQLLVISIAFLSISLLCQPAWSHNKNNTIKYATNPPYDNIPITPKTWEEVDLIYYSTISGHRYTNTIQLLRPIVWLHKRHMDVIGGKVTLSMPEFGIVNVLATVKAIKPTQLDTRGVDWSKQKSAPVIGKFMRYVTDVRTYTFKDSLGHISHINATPNHPFYVKNKHGFVAIENVSDGDTLVGGFGFGDKHMDGAVHLVCDNGKHSHCGVAFAGVDLPTSVYNLEVYKRHVYRVGGEGVVVHNGCDDDITAEKLVSSGEKLGAGVYGTAYKYEGSVYKVYHPGNPAIRAGAFRDETQAERNARVINELNANKETGFIASAIGAKNEILKTPFAEMLYTPEGYDFTIANPQEIPWEIIESKLVDQGRYWHDFNASNMGKYNGKPVIMDVDEVFSIPRRNSFYSDKMS